MQILTFTRTALVTPLLLLACNKNEPVKPVLSDNKLRDATDQLVHQAVKDYSQQKSTAGFSIALVQRTAPGQTEVRYYNYGETVIGSQQLPSLKTFYEIGSLTKVMTAEALYAYAIRTYGGLYMDLMNSTPSDHIGIETAPGFTKNGVKTKAQQLLNHTSGLERLPSNFDKVAGYDPSSPYATYSAAEVNSYLAVTPPAYTPGEHPTAANLEMRYSNLGFGVAGSILKKKTGKSYEESLVAQGLGNWIFTAGGTPLDLAKPHDANGRAAAVWYPMGGFEGAGGLFSNAEKLAAMLRDHLISADGSSGLNSSLAAAIGICTTPSVAINGVNYFGRGWEFFKLSNGKEVTVKDGGTGGSTAFIAFQQLTGRGVVMLTNNHPGNGQSGVFVRLCESWMQ